MDFKKQAEKLVQNVAQAAEKGTERAKDKLDQTKRQIELKRQLKATEEMLNTAYMEIGRAYASAREEEREDVYKRQACLFPDRRNRYDRSNNPDG